jgi:hypothetical protein
MYGITATCARTAGYDIVNHAGDSLMVVNDRQSTLTSTYSMDRTRDLEQRTRPTRRVLADHLDWSTTPAVAPAHDMTRHTLLLRAASGEH